ncbi:hypothetical protein OKW49_006392 [Paraburkholderia youngii]
MGATIFTLVLGLSIAGFLMWSADNGRKRDRERDWGK